MKILSLTAICWFALLSVAAGAYVGKQTGSLSGTVTDAETGEPVAFAYLNLEELNRTVTAHSDGTFELQNIPAGWHTLTAYRVGYQSVTTQIAITPDEEKEVTIIMKATVLSSEAVEVLGQQERTVGARLEHASKKLMGSDLRQNLGTTLAQTLDEIPGFSSRTMGSAPARPVIRGLGGERVLLLQDGERTGDVSAQSSDHAVTVDPMAAEQVEIARGPAALKYGSNAIGGVINVVRNQIATSLPDHMHGTATLQGETVNSGGSGAFEASIPVGTWSLQLDGNVRGAGDIRTPSQRLENSGILATNDAVGLSYIRPWGYAGVAGSLYYNEYGIPPDPGGGHENGVDIEMRKYQGEVKSELFLHHPVFRTLDLDYSYKNYFHREIEPGGEIGTEYGVLTSNVSVSLRHDSLAFFSNGTFGMWGETKNYAVNGANTPDSDAYSFAAYIVEETDVGPLHLELGARFDHISTIPLQEDPDSRIGFIRKRVFNGISSSLSAIYNLDRGFYLGTVLMHSFRAPSREEL
ncbi:MAG: TonB-dependent receptor, partial [Balneolaceae bacterium]|nr:TonB-dependent receptor [Balneolaceae bacterium]